MHQRDGRHDTACSAPVLFAVGRTTGGLATAGPETAAEAEPIAGRFDPPKTAATRTNTPTPSPRLVRASQLLFTAIDFP